MHMANRNGNNIIGPAGLILLTIMLACNTGGEKNGLMCRDTACLVPTHRGTQSPRPDSLGRIPALIAGVVHDQKGKPVAHAQVTIYGNTIRADANGTFLVVPVDLFDDRSNIHLKAGDDFFPV